MSFDAETSAVHDPADRRTVETVSSYLASIAIFVSFLGIFWHPLRLITPSLLVALVAAGVAKGPIQLAGTNGASAPAAPAPVAPPAPAPTPAPPPAPAPAAVPDAELLGGVAAATSLLKAIRMHGHLNARLDPLGAEPPGDPALEPLRL